MMKRSGLWYSRQMAIPSWNWALYQWGMKVREENLLANPGVMVIPVHGICHRSHLQLPDLQHLTDVLVGASSPRLLVLPLVGQLLVLRCHPGHAEPLLEESASPEQIVTVPVAYLRMVCEELPGGHSPAAVGMGGFLVPALGAIREQEGEVERHGTGVEVRHTLEASSPDLDHQIMGVAVGQDTDL